MDSPAVEDRLPSSFTRCHLEIPRSDLSAVLTLSLEKP